MPSFCTDDEWSPVPKAGREVDSNIWEVNEVVMPDGTSWTGSHDHSKWAVVNGTKHIACIGDINRFCSQEIRGGGSLCLESTAFKNAMFKAVKGVDPCWEVDVCTGSSGTSRCYWCDE